MVNEKKEKQVCPLEGFHKQHHPTLLLQAGGAGGPMLQRRKLWYWEGEEVAQMCPVVRGSARVCTWTCMVWNSVLSPLQTVPKYRGAVIL